MAGSPVASTRAIALSRAFSSRVSPVSSTSPTDAGRATSSTRSPTVSATRATISAALSGLAVASTMRSRPVAPTPLPAPVAGARSPRGGGSASDGALRVEQHGDAVLGQVQSSSSSPRVKAMPSAVPCTSTKRPDPVITTFMSTSARESSE